MRGGPVYIVKPKYIFKHPFNKYDLANPTNRETQNEELTDYFNYGFNEDTMNTYGKLVKRFIEVLDHHRNLQYFNEPSELMRLNDEIPMDFGGFCKFHDPSIVDDDTSEDFHTGEPLVKYFIMMIFANASRKIEYPLIEFIKHMYKKEDEEEGQQDTSLYDIIEQIGKNLDLKYQQTMKKLIDKQNEAKNPTHKKGKEDRRDFNRDKDVDRQKDREREREREKQKEKEREKEREREKQREKQREKEREQKAIKQKQLKKDKEKKSKSQSSSDSDSDSDSSDSKEADGKKKKREGKDRSEERSKKHKKKDDKDRDRKKKEKKDKHKTKKVKKEKSHKRSKSRDRKKKHH